MNSETVFHPLIVFILVVLFLFAPVILWSSYVTKREMRECAAKNATFVNLSDGRNVCLKNNSYWEPQP